MVGVAVLDLVANDINVATVFPVLNASRFIRASDKKMLIRVWTISLGLSGPFQVFHDWVNIEQGGGGQFLSSGGI